MKQYFATFPAGTWSIISKHLKGFQVSELKIIENDDSSVLFDSALPIERLIELRYFTNVYLVVKDLTTMPKSAIKGKSFRLMMLKNGEPQPIEPTERADLEAKLTKTLDLTPNAHLSRNDFYVIKRASGKKLFTLRLPRARFKREKLSAGELRPELAHILCLAAGIKAKDTVLDAFAGYGSIPFEAVRGFGCKHVIAVDNQKLPKRHEYPSIEWHEADARNLSFIGDNSIDRVVTDPPWGIFDKTRENLLRNLYQQSLDEMLRILKMDGVAVILSGNIVLDEVIENSRGFKNLKNYPILVSGKKAKIFKLQKILQK